MSDGQARDAARRFASVVFVHGALTHQDRAFTYEIPEGMDVHVGSLVRAPVRGKRTLGVVVDLLADPDIARTVALASVVGPGLPEDVALLARWTAERYLSTEGEAMAAALPQRVAAEEKAADEIGAAGSGAHQGAASALRDLLASYRNGQALSRAIEGGKGGGFVLRMSPAAQRGPLVAAMVYDAVRAGRGALVLLPEVALRSEVADVLHDMFGDTIAWLGSDRPARARYRDWLALRAGRKLIAVAGRSGVFAPVQRLGLIVVDDEAHASYKEGRAPRMHARTVAAERARRAQATVVLVGSPPSAEARAAAESGVYRMVAPPRTAERADRPPVIVIDLAKQESRHTPTTFAVSLATETRKRGMRVVILAHKAGSDLLAIGDRVGRALKENAVTADAGTQRASLVRAVERAAVLVATPVIAKDLAVEGVGLLVLVDVDAALSQPGFRAPEETFATWWRAARWAVGGRIAIETADPSHPAVRALARWDPDVLWNEDATRRRELGYPPFASLARIDVPPERAAAVAEQVRATGLEPLGPIEREGRGVVAVRAAKRDDLLDRLRPLVRAWRAAGEPMRVDIDPWEVMVPRWRS